MQLNLESTSAMSLIINNDNGDDDDDDDIQLFPLSTELKIWENNHTVAINIFSILYTLALL